METAPWHRALALLEQALTCSRSDREAFLESIGRKDPTLRSAVEELLAADEQASPLDQRLIDLPSALNAQRAPDETPTMIGPYRLLRKIGEGGMGTVFLAIRNDHVIEREVVVKIARASLDDENCRRLEQERQILARLDHPAIARLYDVGTTDGGLPYFAMEYVEGLPIDRHCNQHALGVAARLALFREVCAAVRDAHQNLIVHRDLKPSNILVTPTGRPKLLDFGIAKLLDPAWGSSPTVPWQRQLTPSYASPEHIRQQAITTASDVYSLGVLLYELLTGQLPYQLDGVTPRWIEEVWSSTDPMRPSQRVASDARIAHRRKALRGDLDSIVLKALERQPEARYATVDRLVDDLERQQRGFPVEARPIPWPDRAGKLLRRHQRATITLSAMAALTVGFATTLCWQALQVADERDRALRQESQKQAVLETLVDIFRQEDPYLEPQANLTVREALDRTADRRIAMLADQPEVQAVVLHEVGLIYHRLGLDESARRYLEATLALRRALHGSDHASVAETLSLLADSQSDEDGLEAAKGLAHEAVRAVRQDPTAGSQHFVRPLNTLVAILCARGEYEEAGPYALEAVERAQTLPQTNYQRAFATTNLAAVRASQSDYAAAEDLYSEALWMLEEQVGPDHSALTPALINRGVARRHLGRFAIALRDYERAWKLIAHRGAEHPLALRLLNNLGRLRFAAGDFPAARQDFEHALQILEQRGMTSSPLTLRVEMRLAETRIRSGEPEEAEAELRRLLATWEPRLGSDDPWIHQARSILGEALHVQGRDQEAEPLLREAFHALRNHPKPRFRQEAYERLRALHLARKDSATAQALETTKLLF